MKITINKIFWLSILWVLGFSLLEVSNLQVSGLVIGWVVFLFSGIGCVIDWFEE